MTLLATGGLTANNLVPRVAGLRGVATLYMFELSTDPDNLYATVVGSQPNPRVGALPVSSLAGLAFLNQGADLLSRREVCGLNSVDCGSGQRGNCFFQAARQEGWFSFAVGSGGRSRYDSGSHTDVEGFSLLTGLGLRRPLPYGAVMGGVFFEAGWGNYDAHSGFTGQASVKSNGDTSYYGGGLLGRYTLPFGLYLDASLRAGRVDTSFSSSDLRGGLGEKAEHNTHSPYYGAHASLGYAWNVGDGFCLDFSSTYLWTRQEGDSVTMAGDRIHFNTADSQRWRNGVRLSYAATERLIPHVDAAYEYEFDRKARATANSLPLSASDVGGGTGIGGLGLRVVPSLNDGFFFDFSVQGYTGVRQGVSGNLELRWEF